MKKLMVVIVMTMLFGCQRKRIIEGQKFNDNFAGSYRNGSAIFSVTNQTDDSVSGIYKDSEGTYEFKGMVNGLNISGYAINSNCADSIVFHGTKEYFNSIFFTQFDGCGKKAPEKPFQKVG